MGTPERAIPEGQRYRTLCDLEMQVHDYDQLGVQTEVLPAGSLFQPWDPQPHWHGEKVAITVGGGHVEFDWGVTSGEGHFLVWDDFWSRCVPEKQRR